MFIFKYIDSTFAKDDLNVYAGNDKSKVREAACQHLQNYLRYYLKSPPVTSLIKEILDLLNNKELDTALDKWNQAASLLGITVYAGGIEEITVSE